MALALVSVLASALSAETLVATRNLRAETVVGPADLQLREGDTPGALSRAEDAIGLEARRNLYAGQPLRAADLGPPAIVCAMTSSCSAIFAAVLRLRPKAARWTVPVSVTGSV